MDIYKHADGFKIYHTSQWVYILYIQYIHSTHTIHAYMYKHCMYIIIVAVVLCATSFNTHEDCIQT